MSYRNRLKLFLRASVSLSHSANIISDLPGYISWLFGIGHQRFPHYWLLARGKQRSSVDSPHKVPVMRRFDVSLLLRTWLVIKDATTHMWCHCHMLSIQWFSFSFLIDLHKKSGVCWRERHQDVNSVAFSEPINVWPKTSMWAGHLSMSRDIYNGTYNEKLSNMNHADQTQTRMLEWQLKEPPVFNAA